MKLALACAISAVMIAIYAQDAPRSKASDYPVHLQLPSMEIGAEYLVHSIPGPRGGYFAKDYLVVELAVFPAAAADLRISSGEFSLRINNKSTLSAQSAGVVAASIKYSDWEQRRNITAQAGPLIFGAPQSGRFPGDPSTPRPLPSPRVPDQTDSNNVGRDQDLPIETAIGNVALPEGILREPVKGCLFFRFEGKLKSIKSLDLVYKPRGSAAETKIPLL